MASVTDGRCAPMISPSTHLGGVSRNESSHHVTRPQLLAMCHTAACAGQQWFALSAKEVFGR